MGSDFQKDPLPQRRDANLEQRQIGDRPSDKRLAAGPFQIEEQIRAMACSSRMRVDRP